jgi:putative two-component system response regulator
MRLPVRNEPERVFFALAAAAETKDAYSTAHPKRVANIAVHLGMRLGLRESDLLALYRGGLTHDIGKIFVSEAILRKPGPLNAEEERQMREHVVIGERIVRHLPSAADLLPIIRHHHERFDGGGYPDGLCGHKIPLLARIVSVSDAHDALSSDRPYRARRDQSEAIETLMRGAGQQWDRELIALLLSELPAARFELAS